MNDEFRTIIVPDTHVELARSIAAAFGTGGEGMFISQLAPTQEGLATHYVSTGYIPNEFTQIVPCQHWTVDEEGNWAIISEDSGNAQAIHDMVTQDQVDEEGTVIKPGLDITVEEIEELFGVVDITPQDPRTAFSRLGLVQVREDLEDTP